MSASQRLADLKLEQRHCQRLLDRFDAVCTCGEPPFIGEFLEEELELRPVLLPELVQIKCESLRQAQLKILDGYDLQTRQFASHSDIRVWGTWSSNCQMLATTIFVPTPWKVRSAKWPATCPTAPRDRRLRIPNTVILSRDGASFV